MKSKQDIAYIRRLLHKFYEADISPEEEAKLESFFSTTDADDIPLDMAADRKYFLSLNVLRPDSEVPEIPNGLFEKINSAIDDSPEPRVTSWTDKWKNFWLYAAASAIVVAITTTVILFAPSGSDLPGQTYVAAEKDSSHVYVSTVVNPDTVKISEIHKEPAVMEPQSLAAPTTNTVVRNCINRTDTLTNSGGDDGYLEITDPEEVKEIARRIGLLIAGNTDKANEALLHIGKAIEDNKQTTKRLLQ